MRAYIADDVEMWLRKYHVDARRLDAVHALVDTSATDILADLAEHTERLSGLLGRPLSLIADSDLNDPRMITPRGRGGYGMDAQWSDDFHHAVHVAPNLDWHEIDGDAHARMLALYRRLIALRREQPDITDPSFMSTACELSEPERWFVLHRGSISVAVNFSEDERGLACTGDLLLGTEHAVDVADGLVSLPAHSAAVIKRPRSGSR